jgi:pimeloyl-ACP methyl ester carboxylesterase
MTEPSNKTIYCIPGLGIDERLFKRTEVKGYTLKYIKWIMPDKGETMKTYAQKLLPQIEEENPIIIGVSLGGMLATEIADLIPTSKVILISSSKCSREVPLLYRIAGWLGLIYLIPITLVKHMYFMFYLLFGVKLAEDKALLKAVISDTDNTFLFRAGRMVAVWKRKVYNKSIVHIHGTKDLILFPFNIKADCWVKGGGHLMVLLNYREVNNILDRVINQ